jgi:hypothetical protein
VLHLHLIYLYPCPYACVHVIRLVRLADDILKVPSGRAAAVKHLSSELAAVYGLPTIAADDVRIIKKDMQNDNVDRSGERVGANVVDSTIIPFVVYHSNVAGMLLTPYILKEVGSTAIGQGEEAAQGLLDTSFGKSRFPLCDAAFDINACFMISQSLNHFDAVVRAPDMLAWVNSPLAISGWVPALMTPLSHSYTCTSYCQHYAVCDKMEPALQYDRAHASKEKIDPRLHIRVGDIVIHTDTSEDGSPRSKASAVMLILSTAMTEAECTEAWDVVMKQQLLDPKEDRAKLLDFQTRKAACVKECHPKMSLVVLPLDYLNHLGDAHRNEAAEADTSNASRMLSIPIASVQHVVEYGKAMASYFSPEAPKINNSHCLIKHCISENVKNHLASYIDAVAEADDTSARGPLNWTEALDKAFKANLRGDDIEVAGHAEALPNVRNELFCRAMMCASKERYDFEAFNRIPRRRHPFKVPRHDRFAAFFKQHGCFRLPAHRDYGLRPRYLLAILQSYGHLPSFLFDPQNCEPIMQAWTRYFVREEDPRMPKRKRFLLKVLLTGKSIDWTTMSAEEKKRSLSDMDIPSDSDSDPHGDFGEYYTQMGVRKRGNGVESTAPTKSLPTGNDSISLLGLSSSTARPKPLGGTSNPESGSGSESSPDPSSSIASSSASKKKCDHADVGCQFTSSRPKRIAEHKSDAKVAVMHRYLHVSYNLRLMQAQLQALKAEGKRIVTRSVGFAKKKLICLDCKAEFNTPTDSEAHQREWKQKHAKMRKHTNDIRLAAEQRIQVRAELPTERRVQAIQYEKEFTQSFSEEAMLLKAAREEAEDEGDDDEEDEDEGDDEESEDDESEESDGSDEEGEDDAADASVPSSTSTATPSKSKALSAKKSATPAHASAAVIATPSSKKSDSKKSASGAVAAAAAAATPSKSTQKKRDEKSSQSTESDESLSPDPFSYRSPLLQRLHDPVKYPIEAIVHGGAVALSQRSGGQPTGTPLDVWTSIAKSGDPASAKPDPLLAWAHLFVEAVRKECNGASDTVVFAESLHLMSRHEPMLYEVRLASHRCIRGR